jgi:hypothetical protein
LNNEFLKGIEARERLHILKQIRKDDSVQLSYYKYELIPSYQKGIDSCKTEYGKLQNQVVKQKETIKYLKISTLALLLLFIGSILPN